MIERRLTAVRPLAVVCSTCWRVQELLSVELEPLYAALASNSLSSSSAHSTSHLHAEAGVLAAATTVFPPPPPPPPPSHPSVAHPAAALSAAAGPFLSAHSSLPSSRASVRVLHRSGGFIQSRLVLRGCYVSAGLDVACVGSEDCSVTLLHLPTQRSLRRLRGHTGAVNCVAWSRARQCVVSASDDHTLRVWRLRHSPNTQQRATAGAAGRQHAGSSGEEESEEEEEEEEGAEQDDDERASAEHEADSAVRSHRSGGRIEDRKRRRRQQTGSQGDEDTADSRALPQQQQHSEKQTAQAQKSANGAQTSS